MLKWYVILVTKDTTQMNIKIKDLPKLANKKVLVKVVWSDIFGEQSKDKKEIPQTTLREQLPINESYGEIGTVDSGCLEILHEVETDTVTRTVLPTSVIISIFKLNI